MAFVQLLVTGDGLSEIEGSTTVDLNAVTNFVLPTVAVTADGEIGIDISGAVTEFADDLLNWWGGTNIMTSVALAADKLPSGATEDGHTINYNATNNEFELVTAVAGGGDVTGDTASADKELVRWNGTSGTSIESPVTDLSTTTATLSDNADLTLYDAVNAGSPVFRMGSSVTNDLAISAVYDVVVQTLSHVLFQSTSANAAADKGEFRFFVDGSQSLTIDDGGIEVPPGKSYFIHTFEVLSQTVLGSSVKTSSLIAVGPLVSGSIVSGFGAIDIGSNSFTTTGTVAGITADNLVDKSAAEAITGSWVFSGFPFEIPNSDAPTAPVLDGEMVMDNLYTDFSTGLMRIFMSGEEQGVVSMPIAQFTSPAAGEVPTYNTTLDEFELQPGAVADITIDDAWVAAGDLIVGTGTNTAAIVTGGADHTVLTSTGSGLAWSAAPPLAGIADIGDTTQITLSTSSPEVTIENDIRIDGKLGIQSVIGTNNIINLQVTEVAASNKIAFSFKPSYETATGLTFRALQGICAVNATATVGGIVAKGLDYQVTAQNKISSEVSPTFSSITGIDAIVLCGSVLAGAGNTTTVTDAYCMKVTVKASSNVTGNSLITNGYGVFVSTPTAGGSGTSETITNYTGIHIATSVGVPVTLGYGLYIEDADTYALFVDGGLARFDGDTTHVFEVPSDTGAVGSHYGRIPIQITGVGTRYLDVLN